MDKRKMFFFSFLFSFFFIPSLFASGSKEEEVVTLNDQWILCVTAFDYSRLPPSLHVTGNIFTRDLVSKLDVISHRFRISPEYAYYESYAWQQSIRNIARQIAQKQTERSNLLYEGLTPRNYQTRLKTIDTALATLNEQLAEKEANPPLINREPAFGISQANINGTFPAPPQPGAERRFCQTQNADGFLTGEIREFHGRYYLRLRLYTLYTNSYVYEDFTIFSLEDASIAIDEIASQLVTALSGSRPAAVAIRAEPAESQILVNQSFAGRGTVETRERPPGNITVAVAAQDHIPMTVDVDLMPGTLTELSITLGPQLFSHVNIALPDASSNRIYHGAMYIGQAPYNLRLPINQLAYIVVETRNGDEAKAVITTPDFLDNEFHLALEPRTPPPAGVQRVNRARKRSYWAWGGVWITGLTAWVTSGIFSARAAALSPNSGDDFIAATQALNYVRWGAIGLVGAAAVNYFAFQMPRYLRTSTEGSVPIIRQEK